MDGRGTERLCSRWQRWRASSESTPGTADISTLNAAKLEANLLSADSSLRRSSLEILSATSADKEVWDTCLQVENAEMTLRNSREKPTQIARLGRLLLALPLELEQVTFRLALRYLLVQLKVNYRPSYPETIKWFGQLASNRDEAIWELVWAELQQTHAAPVMSIPDFAAVTPAWAQSKPSREREVEDEEDEAEFRCPNLERQNKVVTKALAGGMDAETLDEGEISVSLTCGMANVSRKSAKIGSTSSTMKPNSYWSSATWSLSLKGILGSSSPCSLKWRAMNPKRTVRLYPLGPDNSARPTFSGSSPSLSTPKLRSGRTSCAKSTWTFSPRGTTTSKSSRWIAC